MNVYSCEGFAEAFRAAYYSDTDTKPALFSLGNQVWQLPAVNSTRPIVLDSFSTSFIDFYEPYPSLEVPEGANLRQITYLPAVSHGLVTTAEWHERQLEQTYTAAPTVLWKNFQTWGNFVDHVQQNRSNAFADSRRRHRKLEKQVGNLTFLFDDRRPETMATCMKLKSAQYQRSKCTDHFLHQQHIHFFKELADRNLLLVSSLSSNDQVIAAHMGLLADGRVYYWIPTYDVAFASYSPGRLLLEMLLEESFKQGHTEFDFLIGGESYKWHYATHTRLIAELGSRPLSLRASLTAQSFKQSVKRSLKTLIWA
ncbi:MAG: GNAT family N-acetyltransferase [Myxacorys californica WJT36-NPBG1]|jgi:hypothetical protein|nr:GNAT family N-acetyltransferase [Myxacorys californica WJT36-NPBG1]